MNEAEDVIVGIDVAKAALDVAVRPRGEARQLAHAAAGIGARVGWMQALSPEVLVVAATGGEEAPLVAELGVAHLPGAVVNPRPVRDFARATGRLAKTDRLDAQVVAHCGQAVRPTPRPLPDEGAQALAALVERRRQGVARGRMRTAEENRLGATRVAPGWHQCVPASRPSWPGSRRTEGKETGTCNSSGVPAHSGASRTTCCRACPASAPSSR